MLKRSLGYLVGVCILILIIAQSIIIPTFFMPFFRWQYNRPREYRPFNGQSAVETIGASSDDLLHVTRELLAYMRGTRDSLDGITAVVQGNYREFFSDLEKRHMIDVRVLYEILFTVRNLTFFIFLTIIIGIVVFREPMLRMIITCTRHILLGFLSVVFILTVIISLNFARAWRYFHYIFFDNDYWLLTHRVDLLVDMVSLSFFRHISIFVASLVLFFCLIILIPGSVYLSKSKRKFGFGMNRL